VEQLDRVKLQIQPHTQDLTRTELDIIAKAFTDNTVRKYLQIVLMNQITDHAYNRSNQAGFRQRGYQCNTYAIIHRRKPTTTSSTFKGLIWHNLPAVV
jgi:hypothetical protein